MCWSKRLFDIGFASFLVVVLSPVMAALALAVLLVDGRPVLYRAERIKKPGQSFILWKFRTMRPDPGIDRPLGGDQARRVTALGRILRARRLDELPQLFNILRGDLSFVGPRPPLPRYVARHPALFQQVLSARPGVTGLASLTFHGVEAALLAGCRTEAETDAVYTAICIPAKARLDLGYQANRSLWRDLRLIGQTALVPLRGAARPLAPPPAIRGKHEQRLALAAIGAAFR